MCAYIYLLQNFFYVYKTRISLYFSENDENSQPTIKPLEDTTNTENFLPSSTRVSHNCAQVDLEVLELRRKLVRYKRALEDTCNKLRLSNQIKEQIEKGIKSQILKTHNVLKNARSNIENNP